MPSRQLIVSRDECGATAPAYTRSTADLVRSQAAARGRTDSIVLKSRSSAFAALAGTSPLQAISGRTICPRLNRNGDRALYRAIHTITTTRVRTCPTTRAYVARRTAEGQTSREIRHCLKRYVTWELYRTRTATMTAATQL
ncbi:MAG: transposase [Frankia sp.]